MGARRRCIGTILSPIPSLGGVGGFACHQAPAPPLSLYICSSENRRADFSPSGASAQCHLVFDRKFNMMETAADVTIEERSLGRGGKQVVKQMWWHCGVLVTSAVEEVQLQFTTMLVIAGRGQHRGFQTH